MNVITIESEAFEQLIGKIDALQATLLEKEKQPKEIWLDNQEFIQLLKISKRSAQNFRDSGMISFSQIGAKIYYRLSDVEELLKKHYRKAFKPTNK
ncbi:MAG: helix-turn-helix domain-containing protein [Bacteroidetes bacterium]|nr:helix-turn-helix domain-containing protein [Bacteroidota bacterium]